MTSGQASRVSIRVAPSALELVHIQPWPIVYPWLRLAAAASPFALALAVGLLTLPAGSFSDEGELLMIAARMADGQVLYRDVFTHHFPLSYWLIAALFTLTGPSVAAARLALLLLSTTTFVMLGKATGRLDAAGLCCLAWVLAAPFASANLVIYPSFSAMALLVVFVIGRKAIDTRASTAPAIGGAEALALGAAIAAAGLIDPLSIHPAGVLALALLLGGARTRRRMAPVLLGTLLTLGLALATGAAGHGIGEFWRDAVIFNRQVYTQYLGDAKALRFDRLVNEIKSGLGLNETRFWQDAPSRPLRLADLNAFDAWLFSGAFFRWAVLCASILALAAGRPLRAGYTMAFGAALLSMSGQGFRSLPFQALALWLAAEQIVALPALARLPRRSPPARPQGRAAELHMELERGLLAVTAGSCLLLGAWLCLRCTTDLWRLRHDISWQASLGAYRSRAGELDAMIGGRDDTSLAWFPYEPYVDFFATTPAMGRFPNLLPWTAEWADAVVAEQIARGERAIVGFDATRWFWTRDLDTLSSAPRTWAALSNHCNPIGVAVFACHLPERPPRLANRPDIPADEPIGELIAGRRLLQSFVADCAGLDQVSVQLATYARHNRAHVSIALLDAQGRTLAARRLAGWQVLDNTWLDLQVAPRPDSEGRGYAIELSSDDGQPANAMTVWSSHADRYPRGSASLNEQALDGDLVFAYGCRESATGPGHP